MVNRYLHGGCYPPCKAKGPKCYPPCKQGVLNPVPHFVPPSFTNPFPPKVGSQGSCVQLLSRRGKPLSALSVIPQATSSLFVVVQYSLIYGAALGGWLEKVSHLGAPPRLRRRSPDDLSRKVRCFQRHAKTTSTKTHRFGTPVWFHFGSSWPQCCLHFG